MLSDEEKKSIEEQYKKGLVNLSNVIEPLINQFKTNYSLDIQQCRLIINYLLMERDFNEDYYYELDKEIEELKEGFKIQEHNYQVAMEELEQRWEDKIKAKIEVIEKLQKEFPNNDEIRIKIIAYKELLEKE